MEIQVYLSNRHIRQHSQIYFAHNGLISLVEPQKLQNLNLENQPVFQSNYFHESYHCLGKLDSHRCTPPLLYYSLRHIQD